MEAEGAVWLRAAGDRLLTSNFSASLETPLTVPSCSQTHAMCSVESDHCRSQNVGKRPIIAWLLY